MRSTGSEYESAGGFIRIDKMPRARGRAKKAKEEEEIHDEKWRLVSIDVPTVVAGNGGRPDAPWVRTDLVNYLKNLD